MNIDDFKLGEYLIKPKQGQICSNDKCQSIEPKAMAVLCLLKQHSGEVVSQQTLFDAVWPDRVFSPSSLQRIIALLRKALNESSQKPAFLFTHPKLGYRLEGVVESKGTKKNPESPINKVAMALISVLAFFAFLVFLIDFNDNTKHSIQVSALTFSDNEEFKAKFSSGGKYISYLQQNNNEQTLVILDKHHQELYRHALTVAVIDYKWHDDNNAIALIENSDLSIEIIRMKNITNDKISIEKIATFPELSFPYALELLDSMSLVFTAKSVTGGIQSYQLYKYNIVSNTLTSASNLGAKLRHVTLANSSEGLWIQFLNEKESKLGRIAQSSDAEWFDIDLPEFAAIDWSEHLSSLIVSDTLSANQFQFHNGKLVQINLSEEDVITELDVFEDKILASTQKRDMDIVHWQNNAFNQVINTKFPDYLVRRSNAGTLVYNSNRVGYPQLFIQNNGIESLAFANKNKANFIPPASWHPNKEKLSFSVDGKMYVFSAPDKSLEEISFAPEIERVISWTPQETIMVLTKDLTVIEVNLNTESTSVHEFSSPEFVSRDNSGNFYGIEKHRLFWADRSIVEEDKKPLFAFALDKYLVVHWQSEELDEVSVYDQELSKVYKSKLPEFCDIITEGELTNFGNFNWYCTRYTSKDSDVLKFALP